jgi:hypothetical protein
MYPYTGIYACAVIHVLIHVTQNKKFYHARATEVVISMGDVLYLPAYWFHFIVSLDAGVQCSSRSGDSENPIDAASIEKCGYKRRNREKYG